MMAWMSRDGSILVYFSSDYIPSIAISKEVH